MTYTAKDFSFLLGMKGFSDTLLKNHFTLYQGYVTNTNKVLDLLAALLKDGKEGTPEFAELKRRLGWEFNGMRLHELYFENLGGDGDPAKAPEPDQTGGGPVRLRGCLRQRLHGRRLHAGHRLGRLLRGTRKRPVHQHWINEHDVGHLAGCNPRPDSGRLRTCLYDRLRPQAGRLPHRSFFNNVKWEVVEQRLL